MTYILDARPDRIDLRDREYTPPLVNLDPEYPKPEVVKKYLPSYKRFVFDQGKEGACTGFGLAAVINFRLWQKNDYQADSTTCVSPWMLYYMARRYDEWEGEDYDGSSCRGAMRGWHRHGACQESFWGPPKNHKMTKPKKGWAQDAAGRPLGAYYRVARTSISDIQAAIFECKSVFVSARTHRGWGAVKKNAKSLPTIKFHQEREGGHAFALVGYNRQGFILQNSWGPSWGYHGFALLTYQDWVRHGMDAWVAVLGAPMEVDKDTTKDLSGFQFDRFESLAERKKDLGEDYPYKNAKAKPWPKHKAELHTLVFGEGGKLINRLPLDLATTPRESAEVVAFSQPKEWLQNKNKKRIVIFAHGGLNDEKGSFKRVRVLCPYFVENEIYPIFINWKTGAWEIIKQLFKEDVTFGDRAGNIFDDAKDESIEFLSRGLPRKIWSRIKSNAKDAADPGRGLFALAEELAKLRGVYPDLEIHHLGHSAGSILLGYLLKRLQAKSVPSQTATLFAPACTVKFTLDFYKKAVDNGQLPNQDSIVIHSLHDDLEKGDTAGPYGKSLLYLICRALEPEHKTPVLGMARVWNGADDNWHSSTKNNLAKFRSWIRGKTLMTEHFDEQIPVSERKMDKQTHGSFDNNIKIMGDYIKRIRGSNLKLKIENLGEV